LEKNAEAFFDKARVEDFLRKSSLPRGSGEPLKFARPETGEDPAGIFDLPGVARPETGEDPAGIFDLPGVARPETGECRKLSDLRYEKTAGLRRSRRDLRFVEAA